MKKYLAGAIAGLFVVMSGTYALDQLSRGDSEGTKLGQSITDKLSFFGVTTAVQPSGNAQAAVTRGSQAGVIATFASTQSPAAVAQGTTAEQTLTIQSGTGGTMLLAAGDLVYVNKPTSQAGLGVGNVRVSSGNTLGITFDNIPAGGGNITPTGSQAYTVVALRGMGTYKLTAVLSPAAVAANTTAEQSFTVTGARVGDLIQVNKPTAQAGLDIGNVRVVSNNTVGITFVNATASPITPTASESYIFVGLPGLDAVNNDIFYGMNVGTVGAIGPGRGDGWLHHPDRRAGHRLRDRCHEAHAAGRGDQRRDSVRRGPTADTMTLSFFGVGTGYTPTASEVYGIRTARIAPAAPLLLYSPSIAPASVAASTCAEQTFTVAGLDCRLGGVGEQAQRAGWSCSRWGARLGGGHAGDQLLQLHRNRDRPDDRDLRDRQLPGEVARRRQRGLPVGVPPLSAATTLANAIRSGLVTLGLLAGS
jgi:hypothetical protein